MAVRSSRFIGSSSRASLGHSSRARTTGGEAPINQFTAAAIFVELATMMVEVLCSLAQYFYRALGVLAVQAVDARVALTR